MRVDEVDAYQQVGIRKNFFRCPLRGQGVLFAEDKSAVGHIRHKGEIMRGRDEGFARRRAGAAASQRARIASGDRVRLSAHRAAEHRD